MQEDASFLWGNLPLALKDEDSNGIAALQLWLLHYL